MVLNIILHHPLSTRLTIPPFLRYKPLPISRYKMRVLGQILGQNPKNIIILGQNPKNIIILGQNPKNIINSRTKSQNIIILGQNPKKYH